MTRVRAESLGRCAAEYQGVLQRCYDRDPTISDTNPRLRALTPTTMELSWNGKNPNCCQPLFCVRLRRSRGCGAGEGRLNVETCFSVYSSWPRWFVPQ